MKEIKLAIMGFGNAAKAFTKILVEKRELMAADGLCFKITAVSTGSKGNLLGEALTPELLLETLEKHGNFRTLSAELTELNTLELIQQADYDVMIELTPLEIFSGQPAISHIEAALKRQKHVITANKGPIAWAYKELTELAKAQDVKFLYETTVMDGTPIFNLFNKTLPYCKVTEIKGILNTTTNFVLEHLAKGEPLDDVMAEGRRRGFVEADPSLDIDGWDAAAKLTALMNVLMDAGIKPTDVKRQGIAHLTEADLKLAKSEGQTIKLLCRGFIGRQGPEAIVEPVKLPLSSLYAAIDETSSVVTIRTDLMGELSIVEHNPEIEQTGFGIFSDLIALLL
jgi:homoserine dehydrogenase